MQQIIDLPKWETFVTESVQKFKLKLFWKNFHGLKALLLETVVNWADAKIIRAVDTFLVSGYKFKSKIFKTNITIRN